MSVSSPGHVPSVVGAPCRDDAASMCSTCLFPADKNVLSWLTFCISFFVNTTQTERRTGQDEVSVPMPSR